jgi:hypothetical protein
LIKIWCHYKELLKHKLNGRPQPPTIRWVSEQPYLPDPYHGGHHHHHQPHHHHHHHQATAEEVELPTNRFAALLLEYVPLSLSLGSPTM